MRRRLFVLPQLLLLLTLSSCGNPNSGIRPKTLATNADELSQIAAYPTGGMIFAERSTGRIRRIDEFDKLMTKSLGRIPILRHRPAQILGLAVDRKRNVYASWVDIDGMLSVEQILPESNRLIWRTPQQGPVHKMSGRIRVTRDGRIIIGISNWPTNPPSPIGLTGALLSINSRYNAQQIPRAISNQWRTPAALTFLKNGRVWVADRINASGDARIALGNRAGKPLFSAKLPPGADPTGIAAISNYDLLICGQPTSSVLHYQLDQTGYPSKSADISIRCSGDITRLSSGRVAYVDGNSVRVARVSALGQKIGGAQRAANVALIGIGYLLIAAALLRIRSLFRDRRTLLFLVLESGLVCLILGWIWAREPLTAEIYALGLGAATFVWIRRSRLTFSI